MFRTFSLQNFGLEIAIIRKDLGYSLREVGEATGINKNTLSAIESGKSLPKFETLEILSVFYKIDLLEVLLEYRSSLSYLVFYKKLDKALTSMDVNIVLQMKEQLKNMPKEQIIDFNEVKQLEILLDAIHIRYLNNSHPVAETEDKLLSAIKLANKDFKIKNINKYRFSFIELRILYVLAAFYGLSGKIDDSNTILEYLYVVLPTTGYNYDIKVKMKAKIVSSIAYNFYRIAEHEQTIKYCDEGIKLCIENELFNSLDLLYFRKGIAYKYLKDERADDYLKKSLYVIYSTNNMEKFEHYKKVLKDRYDLDFGI